MTSFDPDYVSHPGATLAEVLEHLGLPDGGWEGVLSGATPIDATIADRLEHVTHVTAGFWLERERLFREGLASGKTWVGRPDGGA